jgi:hypothetical protein
VTTKAEEVPFIAAMEHEPPKFCETTIAVSKKLFALDGMLTRILEKARMAMGRPERERGPDPDADLRDDRDDDDIRRLASIIERLVQRQPDNGYHEGPKESGLKAIVIGCTITLLSAMIIAAFMLTNEFAAFKAQVNEWQKSTDRRLEMLERRP